MSAPLARFEQRGSIGVVINSNAKRRGALSLDLYAAILEASEAKGVRAIVLTSEGGFFCAGGDLNVLRTRSDLTEAERAAEIEKLHDVTRALRNCPVPVIAAIEGGAAGAGFSLALAADMIIAAEGAGFTAAYVKAGLVPDGGLTAGLARALPRQLAMEICLLGQSVPAERMFALGVVSQIVPEGRAEGTALALAAVLANGPREAQASIKALVSGAYEADEAAQLDAEKHAMARAIGSAEAAEGTAAFLEKRSPKFPA